MFLYVHVTFTHRFVVEKTGKNENVIKIGVAGSGQSRSGNLELN